MNFINQYTNQIEKLCSKHNVKRLYIFGSALTKQFNLTSDIDLIVDFEARDLKTYADNYYDFKFALEDAFNRPVDLVEEKAIKNPYFLKSIENQKQLIYGS